MGACRSSDPHLHGIAPGTPVEALDTPVLLLDLDIFERSGRPG
ncbi:MAG: hypothetical protein U0869_04705 [Chloroflexota bacterium]